MGPLARQFFARDAVALAPALLGSLIDQDEANVVLRITEVEAYRPDDSACHAFRGPTARNAVMFGSPGRLYVYLCYGIHHMLNIVADREGVGAAVLVRAAEVVAGSEVVRRRRGRDGGPELLAGPGKVAQALGLDRDWNGHDLCAPGGIVLRPGPAPRSIAFGPRIGIDYARPDDVAAPWRFADADSASVSHRRRLNVRSFHSEAERE